MSTPPVRSGRSASLLGLLAATLLSLLAGLAGCEGFPGAAASGDGAWRREFAVARAKLGPLSANPYFSLEPGRHSRFTGGNTVLTITVLDATKVVDGVTTRVVEERETEAGQLKEVSRNYFACDRATGDVYYFGEDVDIYKDGKVASHEGAWLSGVNGAKFGLMLPGRPQVGDAFYQERAPGVALDRATIVRADETVTTPAGTFTHCVQVRESSALESGSGYKWYAPGVGLIKDGAVELVEAPAAGK